MEIIDLPCGSEAEFDYPSGISYRCTTCLAVVGSVAVPRECAILFEMQDMIDKIKGNNNGKQR